MYEQVIAHLIMNDQNAKHNDGLQLLFISKYLYLACFTWYKN